MKTFEEAMQDRHVRSKSAFRMKSENLERYTSLVEEIGASPQTKHFIDTIRRHMEPTTELDEEEADLLYQSMLFTAFINGVLVGIEMEKQDS